MSDSLHRLSDRAMNRINRAMSVRPSVPSQLLVGLIISDEQQYSLRELSDYLEQADRLFGRLAVGNLRSYARSGRSLYVRSIRPRNSFELILEIIRAADNPFGIIFGLIIARLPNFVKLVPETLNAIEDFRLKREDRRLKHAQRIELEAKNSGQALLPVSNMDGVAQLVEKTISVESQDDIARALSGVAVFEEFDEETKAEVAFAIQTAIAAELATRPRELAKALVFNRLYSQGVVLTVQSPDLDPSSETLKLGSVAVPSYRIEPQQFYISSTSSRE